LSHTNAGKWRVCPAECRDCGLGKRKKADGDVADIEASCEAALEPPIKKCVDRAWIADAHTAECSGV
jgi:hypothetical protein